ARVALDDAEMALDVGRWPLSACGDGPAEDRIEGRTQLVRYGCEKLVLRSVRELRIGARPPLALEQLDALFFQLALFDAERRAARELFGKREVVVVVAAS